MQQQNLTNILNKFKLSPNDTNYQAALAAMLFYRVKWAAFMFKRKPEIREAKTSMLHFTVKHETPNSSHSLLVVAGEDTFQIAPGCEQIITLTEADQRITIMRVLHTTGDPDVMNHEYTGEGSDDDDTDPESTTILDDIVESFSGS